jgi:hypothetical protein
MKKNQIASRSILEKIFELSDHYGIRRLQVFGPSENFRKVAHRGACEQNGVGEFGQRRRGVFEEPILDLV